MVEQIPDHTIEKLEMKQQLVLALRAHGIDLGAAFVTDVEGQVAIGLIREGHIERVTLQRLTQVDPEYVQYLKEHWGVP